MPGEPRQVSRADCKIDSADGHVPEIIDELDLDVYPRIGIQELGQSWHEAALRKRRRRTYPNASRLAAVPEFRECPFGELDLRHESSTHGKQVIALGRQ